MTEENRNDQGVSPSTPETATPQPPAYPTPQPQPQPQQQVYAPPQPQQPVFYPPAPLMQLTGGMKFAWLVVGALMGIPGIIIAWLVNVDKMPQVKSDALKFAIIGFVVWIVLGILVGILVFGSLAAMAAAIGSSAGSYDYGYYGSW